MSDVVIKVENLAKAYRIGLKEQKSDTLGGAIVSWIKSPGKNYKKLKNLAQIDTGSRDTDIFWALRDVSFEMKQGEVLGVIGKNGAGKSTLLKILSKITDPTQGEVHLNGRVASLLEVGTGFNPDLTGRENVYLNGTILGMTKKEVDRKFDEMIDFSGVEKFIDTPVKWYSSGMRVRLAFAVAAYLEPEILIVDEVLAVGDAEFQKKCLGKMKDVAGQGRTILFVSHNMAAIENLCNRGLVLNKGTVQYSGDIDSAVREYISTGMGSGLLNYDLKDYKTRKGKGGIRITDLTLLCNGMESRVISSGSQFEIILKYQVFDEILHYPRVRIGFLDSTGYTILACTSDTVNTNIEDLKKGEGTISYKIDNFPFANGSYSLDIWIKSNLEMEDHLDGIVEIDVEGGDFFKTGKRPPKDCGHIYVPYSYDIN